MVLELRGAGPAGVGYAARSCQFRAGLIASQLIGTTVHYIIKLRPSAAASSDQIEAWIARRSVQAEPHRVRLSLETRATMNRHHESAARNYLTALCQIPTTSL